jgi:hypothetical protein
VTKTKPEYLYLKPEEMNALKEKACELDNMVFVFRTPNDVLRDLLGLAPKLRMSKEKPEKQLRKIRVDLRVKKEMAAYAEKYKMQTKGKRINIKDLLEHVSRHEVRRKYGEEEQLIGQRLPARRAGGRPATR